MPKSFVSFCFVLGLSLIQASAAEPATPGPGKQVELSLKINKDQSMPYLLHLPKDYEDKKGDWPMILFLHGRGESYGPLSIVKKWGPPMMAERGDKLPYVVVSPQCPGDSRWTEQIQQEGLIKLLDEISERYRIDQSRIYLTGLSMGGYGSWTLAAKHPDRFAAVAPICGGGRTEDAAKLKDIPIWAFHGTDDKVVPFSRSEDMVNAVKAAGGNRIQLTSLEGIDHNSWSSAYATPNLYSWFNKHTLKPKK